MLQTQDHQNRQGRNWVIFCYLEMSLAKVENAGGGAPSTPENLYIKA